MTEHQCVICQRRPYARAQVCDGCRTWLAGQPGLIAELHAGLDDALVPATSGGQRVSGSREAPLPLAVDALDLGLPARAGTITDPYDDQVGHVSVATVLDTWVRDWAGQRREGLPAADVATLARWLADRTDWACDTHTAVDEYAAELRQLTRTLRVVTGTAQLVVRLPAPCPDCDLLSLIRADGEDHVRCTECGRLWTEDEYQRLAIVVAAGLWDAA